MLCVHKKTKLTYHSGSPGLDLSIPSPTLGVSSRNWESGRNQESELAESDLLSSEKTDMSGGVADLGSCPSTPSGDNPDGYTHYFHQTPDHFTQSFTAINLMRHNIQLCDVTLRCGMDTIHAHRVVLASTSPYFHAMFNDDMVEKGQTEIGFQDIDAMALRHLVDFSYTGEIMITEENVQVLLPASSLLQISSVREACCKFLMRQLHPSNCLGIRSFADTHSCKELHRRSHKYALLNFQEVMNTEEFLLLPFSQVSRGDQFEICDQKSFKILTIYENECR
ncbi:hypothetical protein M8J76_008035 [Diaphorina citri]|nr:hypothetical protein M8J76_008035 [Diaphorina citri]